MRVCGALLACGAAAVAGPPLWPQVGGNAAQTFCGLGTGPQQPPAGSNTTLSVVWTFSGSSTGVALNFSPPTVDAAGVPYFGTDGGVLYALDPSSGVPVWTLQAAATGWVTSPAFADDGSFFVFVAANTSVVAFTPDRRFAWTAVVPAAPNATFGSLTVVNTTGTALGGGVQVIVRVSMGTWAGDAVVLDGATGTTMWVLAGAIGPPAVDPVSGMVLAPTTSGQRAFHPISGAVNWTANANDCANSILMVVPGSGARPSVAIFNCYAGFAEYEVTTGTLLATSPIPMGYTAATTPDGIPNYFGYLNSLSGYEAWKLPRLWTTNLVNVQNQNQAVDANGVIFATSADGSQLLAINGTSGATVYSVAMPFAITATSLAVGGGLLFTSGVGSWGAVALGQRPGPQPPTAAPWPCWGGNPQHTAVTKTTGPTGPAVKPAWTASVAGSVQSSFAVGADGSVYFGTDAGVLVVVDKTGTVMSYQLPGAVNATPAISADGNYVWVGAGDGNLYALSTASGQVTMLAAMEGAIPSAVVDPVTGTFYTGTYMTSLTGWNELGQRLWTAEYFGTPTASVALSADGQNVTWPTAYGALVYTTLAQVGWTVQVSPIATALSSPTMGPHGAVYIGSADGNLYGFVSNGSNAVPVLQFATGGAVGSSPALDADNILYFGSADSFVYAVNATDGTLRWKHATGGPVWASPIVDGSGTIIVGSTDGVVYGLSSATGEVVWSYAMGAPVRASAAITAAGFVIIAAEAGPVVALASA